MVPSLPFRGEGMRVVPSLPFRGEGMRVVPSLPFSGRGDAGGAFSPLSGRGDDAGGAFSPRRDVRSALPKLKIGHPEQLQKGMPLRVK